MVIGGWMFWDAEAHNWRPHSEIRVREITSLEAFERAPETGYALCRPCNEQSHAECEGAGTCRCPCRDSLSLEFLIAELEDNWRWSDTAKQWPD